MEVARCAQCLKDNAPQFLTVDEIAQMMRVSQMTVYRWVKSGQLKSMQFGRTIRIHANDFDDYLKRITSVA